MKTKRKMVAWAIILSLVSIVATTPSWSAALVKSGLLVRDTTITLGVSSKGSFESRLFSYFKSVGEKKPETLVQKTINKWPEVRNKISYPGAMMELTLHSTNVDISDIKLYPRGKKKMLALKVEKTVPPQPVTKTVDTKEEKSAVTLVLPEAPAPVNQTASLSDSLKEIPQSEEKKVDPSPATLPIIAAPNSTPVIPSATPAEKIEKPGNETANTLTWPIQKTKPTLPPYMGTPAPDMRLLGDLGLAVAVCSILVLGFWLFVPERIKQELLNVWSTTPK